MPNVNEITFVKKTLREQIADILREKIIKGAIAPGERIIEEEISKEYEVSRGPVREALRQIEEEGLISYVPHKGCVVKTLSHRDMQESYMIRSTLECLAVKIYSAVMSREGLDKLAQCIEDIRTAGANKELYDLIEADERFHSTIVEDAGCEKLYQMWKQLQGGNISAYYTMDTENLMPYEMVANNHQKILNLFLQKAGVEKTTEAIYAHYMIVPETLYQKEHPKEEE